MNAVCTILPGVAFASPATVAGEITLYDGLDRPPPWNVGKKMSSRLRFSENYRYSALSFWDAPR